MIHGCELGLVDLDVLIAKFLARLLLRKPARARGWVREHNSGDKVKVLLGLWVGLKQPVSELAASGNRNFWRGRRGRRGRMGE